MNQELLPESLKEVLTEENVSAIETAIKEKVELTVEAALAGNYVIGYTGEGGKDYWKKPIFTEIYSGDIREFVKKTIQRINSHNLNNKHRKYQYIKLVNEFSKKNEIDHIKKFLKKIS